MVVASLSVYHDHIIFFNHSSCNHYTRTKHNRYNMIHSENTQYITHISKLSQSKSSAINNQSLWRENLQSGGSSRTTTPTVYEPKELATVSRIEDFPGDPLSILMYRNFGEQDHRAPITEEVVEFGEIGIVCVLDCK